jgi:hypothetical protein
MSRNRPSSPLTPLGAVLAAAARRTSDERVRRWLAGLASNGEAASGVVAQPAVAGPEPVPCRASQDHGRMSARAAATGPDAALLLADGSALET